MRDINVIIGNNIQYIRKSRKLTQIEVSELLTKYGRGISRGQYSHIEQGKQNINASDIALLKVIFDAEYADFFWGIDIKRADTDM